MRRASWVRGGGQSVLALVVLTACRVGTDLPTEDPVALELAEAEQVAAALLDVTLENSVFSANHVTFMHAHGDEGPHAHPVQGPYVHELDIVEDLFPSHHNLFDFELSVESPCSQGGSVLVEAVITGEGNPAVEVGAVHYTMIQTHQGCSLTLDESDDLPLVLNASPYLEAEAHATNDGATATLFGSFAGALGWQAEAKGGSCELDLSYEGNGPTLSDITEAAVTGTFCGLTIDTTIPFS